MLYVGVAAHKSTSQITVMNEAGVILQRKRVHSTREGFKEALAGYDEPFQAVLEAATAGDQCTTGSTIVSEEVLLAHPLKVRAIASAWIKHDQLDFGSSGPSSAGKSDSGSTCAVPRDPCAPACPPATDVFCAATDDAPKPDTCPACPTFRQTSRERKNLYQGGPRLA